MKKIALFLLMSGSLLLSLSCNKDPETTNPADPGPDIHQAKIDFLNQVLHPLSGSDPTLPSAELAPLAPLADARFIGLGEASHGTHEFFQVKDRLIRYLVTEHNLRAVGFEGFEFSQSLAFDRYVTTGEGDPEELLQPLQAYRSEEIRDLLVWLKDYNQEKPAEEQFRFFGIDPINYAGQAEVLESRLRPYRSDLADTVAVKLAGYAATLDQYFEWDQTTLINNRPQAQNPMREVVAAIRDAFDELATLATPAEARIILQVAEIMEQTENIIYNRQYNRENSELFRDQYMARNAGWISEHLDGGKVAIWAHNGHVANDNFFQNLGSSMGHLLRAEYGADYLAVGLSKGSGLFHAWSFDNPLQGAQVFSVADPAKNSTNDLFSRAEAPQYFILLDELTENAEWAEWCRTERPFLGLGVIYDPAWLPELFEPIELSTHFDVIFHFDETTLSILLK